MLISQLGYGFDLHSSVGARGADSKYDVLVLHRESDNVCVVRLRGYDNRVFWREIKLNPQFSFFKSPRTKILDAQHKASRLAEKLRRSDDIAQQTYNGSIRL